MVNMMMLANIIHVHAILATLSWGLFFPLGAVMVRVVSKNARNVHWPIQVFALLCFTAAFGLGAWIATTLKLWVTFNGHAIIGTIIFALTLTMPLLGLAHHYNYISKQSSYKFAWIHVWLGRILILAAIINGGLGLQLGYYETKMYTLHQGQIAYGVCAGFIALVWIAVSIMACVRSNGDVARGGESGPKISGVAAHRSDSQDTAVAEKGELQKEKFDEDRLNGTHPAHEAPVNGATTNGNHAAAPAAATAGSTGLGHSTQTTTTTTVTGGNAAGTDTVHGGEHYNTRLADVIDPNVQKTDGSNTFKA